MRFVRTFGLALAISSSAVGNALSDEFKGCALPGTAASDYPTADEAALDCVRAIFEVEKTQASNLQLLITSITLLNQKLGEVAASSTSLASAVSEQQGDLQGLLTKNNEILSRSEGHIKNIITSQNAILENNSKILSEAEASTSVIKEIKDALSSGGLRIVIQDN